MADLFASKGVVAKILLPLPLPEPFDYSVPETLNLEVGQFVEVPLANRKSLGLVMEVYEGEILPKLKAVEKAFDTNPLHSSSLELLYWLTHYTCTPMGNVLRMMSRSRAALLPSPVGYKLTSGDWENLKLTPARQKVFEALEAMGTSPTIGELASAANVSHAVISGLTKKGAIIKLAEPVDKPYPRPQASETKVLLTEDQKNAADILSQAFEAEGFESFLLDGITGSGKTEVYFEAINSALIKDPNAQILVLLPEIALTQSLMERFEVRFGARPIEWHSDINPKEKRRAWREINAGRGQIIVGARSALFLPFQKLALIIIDEEHDTSYKQEDGVAYHARDVGLMLGKFSHSKVILASATPSLETMRNITNKTHKVLKLSARPGTASLPLTQLIDMKEDGPESGLWLAPSTVTAIKDRLDKQEQALLFINRRGYAPLVLCKACGQKLKAPNTDSWLVEHRYTGRLVCHLTGYSIPKPDACPHCAAKNSLAGVGPGVERIAEETRSYFPKARIAIFSSDTAHSASKTRELVTMMEQGEIDIMIGTQIVAKGHNFPNLTLVSIIDADSGFMGGDLRGGERTYQLLTQVAGRAGRADKPGQALIQTYQPENPALQALVNNDRDGFLALELEQRKLTSAPPYGRYAALKLSGPDAASVDHAASLLRKAIPKANGIEVWGPAPAPITIIRGRHRRRFLAHSARNKNLSAFMTAWLKEVKLPSNIRYMIDIDPYSFL